MPSSIVISDSDVVNIFDNLQVELRGVIRREIRGSVEREKRARLAEEIITLVRSRWDNAPSFHHWWTQMIGADLSIVSLNSLHDRLANLGVNVDRVLHALAKTYGWLTSPLLIVDDTITHKYGIRMQGVSSVRVANVKGGVLGHNVVTSMVACPAGSASRAARSAASALALAA